MNTCSHVWKDRRFIHQFVYNWPIAPYVEPDAPRDGQPRKHMQYGQVYECQNCRIPLYVGEPLQCGDDDQSRR